MNKQLLTYDKQNTDKDVYNIKIIKGNHNPPQRLNVYPTCVETKQDTCIYTFIVTDISLDGINNIGLSLKLPEIRGKGIVRYPEDFIYKLIDNFSIYIDEQLIISKIGKEFASAFYNEKDNYVNYKMYLTGNNTYLCSSRKGDDSDQVIFKSMEIYAPLKFMFDVCAGSILRIPTKSELRFELTISKFHKLLYYNSEFAKHTLANYEKVDLQPKLIYDGYNTLSDVILPRYVEQLCLTNCELITPKDNYKTIEFEEITNILCYSISNNYTEKKIIAYPDYPIKDEKLIKCFVDKIVSDLVIVSNTPDFMKLKGFSQYCDFKQVIDNTITFPNGEKCKVIIKDVPDGYNVYYHANILTFNRKPSSIIYNISEKFSYILGVFVKEDEDIHILKIEHDIDIYDASIPVEIWTSQKNTATGDLRSKRSKYSDLRINDPFILGTDLLSKNKGFSKIVVKQGDNNAIIDCNSVGLYDSQINMMGTYPVSVLGKYMYQPFIVIRFNKLNSIICEPSKIVSNKENNFRSCSINVTWDKYDNNDPRSLMDITLHVGVTKLHRLLCSDGKLKIE